MKEKNKIKRDRPADKTQEIPFGAKPNGQYVGLTYGYHVTDGKYYLAPPLRESMRDLGDERMGIQSLLELITNHCSSLLSKIQRRKDDWFDTVSSELGVTEEQRHRLVYYPDGYVALKPEETTPKPDA